MWLCVSVCGGCGVAVCRCVKLCVVDVCGGCVLLRVLDVCCGCEVAV